MQLFTIRIYRAFINFDVLLGEAMACIFFAATLFATSIANALPACSSFSHSYDCSFSLNLEGNDGLHQADLAIPKIGRIIEGPNLLWGESIGWINLKAKHADLMIGSNIMAGWIWLENCGWVCLGEGYPLNGERYSHRDSSDWGVNNDGKGNLSGYAWSEVTGWINFRTSHSRVYLNENSQFCTACTKLLADL